MHDAEVQVERVLVRPPAVEHDGARPVQLVLGLREPVDDLLQEGLACERLEGIELGHGATHGAASSLGLP